VAITGLYASGVLRVLVLFPVGSGGIKRLALAPVLDGQIVEVGTQSSLFFAHLPPPVWVFDFVGAGTLISVAWSHS